MGRATVWSMMKLVLILVLALPVWGATLQVDPNSIAQSVSDAQDGDTLELAAGVYNVSLSVSKRLTFSSPIKGAAIFTCNDINSPAIQVQSIRVTVVNIVFAHCANNGALGTVYGSLTIESCEFYENAVAVSLYIGLADITDSIMHDNDLSFTSQYSNYTMTRVSVYNNTKPNSGTISPVSSHGVLTDCVFSNNAASAFGGSIKATSPGSLVLNNCKFENGQAYQGGAISIYQLSSMIVNNCTFTGMRAYQGSAIHITSASEIPHVQIINSRFINSSSDFGAVFSSAGFLDISGSTFANNVKANSTTAVYAKVATVTMTTCSFDSNSGSYTTMFDFSSSVTIQGCTFSLNVGSSVATQGHSTVNVLTSKFNGNSATTYGGAGVWATNARLDIRDSEVTLNIAAYSRGSGAYLSNSTFTASNVAFDGNKLGGPSMVIVGGSAVMSKVTFSGNGMPGSDGGGVLASNGCTLDISDSLFQSNLGRYGAGMNIDACTVKITRTRFLSNLAFINGGGAYFNNANLELTNSTFTSNTASIGGGLYFRVGTSPAAYIADTTVTGNGQGTADGIYVDPTLPPLKYWAAVVRMQRVNITTSSRDVNFCCGGVKKTTTVNDLCSFPACDSAQCLETTGGCECPFNVANGYSSSDGPILNYTNTTCTCASDQWLGTNYYCQQAVDICSGYPDACDSLTSCSSSGVAYSCTACPGGYTGTGATGCIDINECQNGAYCDPLACVNTPGSYDCGACPTGYNGNGTTGCADINECDLNKCDPLVTCTNLPGGYNCTSCPPGFIGTGYTHCIQLNICDLDKCDPRVTCTSNGTSNYTCGPCPPGFSGSGYTKCEDINECNPKKCDPLVSCENTEGNYTCGDCPYGYHGSGYTQCIANGEACNPNPCKANQICNTTPGDLVYNCTCISGYVMKGTDCVDFNECDINNGGCDPHVTCRNIPGSYECPPCPSGMTGNSYNHTCQSLCGNGVCEPEIGETCVTCNKDCSGTTCNSCGDGKCDVDSGENCTSCYEDCQRTLCTIACAKCVNGLCNNKGACICFDHWSGPACDVENQEVEVGTNETKPVVTVTTGTQTSFSIGILSLQERTDKNEVVSTVQMATGDQNFTFLGNLTKDLASASIWSYKSALANKASVNFTFYQFETTTNMSFADQTYTFSPHTLKFTVNVSSWPFQNIKNNLAVVLESLGTQTGECDGSTISNSGDADHLQWVKIAHKGTTLYGQFSDAAIVDGRYRSIKFSMNQTTNQIAAILPHFWVSAEFDPAYSVLVGVDSSSEDDSCLGNQKGGSKGTSKTLVIAVAAGVVGAAILTAVIGGSVVYFRKRRRENYLESRSSVNMKDNKHRR